MVIIVDLTDAQIAEIKEQIKKMKLRDIEDGFTTVYKFANKCTMEEMMMKVALSYNPTE